MKITIQTAMGDAPPLEMSVDAATTVLDVKNHVRSEHPAKPAVSEQKILFFGRLLADKDLVQDLLNKYNLKEAVFQVLIQVATTQAPSTPTYTRPVPVSPTPQAVSFPCIIINGIPYVPQPYLFQVNNIADVRASVERVQAIPAAAAPNLPQVPVVDNPPQAPVPQQPPINEHNRREEGMEPRPHPISAFVKLFIMVLLFSQHASMTRIVVLSGIAFIIFLFQMEWLRLPPIRSFRNLVEPQHSPIGSVIHVFVTFVMSLFPNLEFQGVRIPAEVPVPPNNQPADANAPVPEGEQNHNAERLDNPQPVPPNEPLREQAAAPVA